MTLEPFLTVYGYPILYLGTIVEGETFVIISATLCQTGHLEVIWVIGTAFLGALTGDLVCFQVGRFSGGKFLKKGSRWQRRAEEASILLQRHQNLVIFSYRFFYGLRAVIPYVIGMTDYNFRRFLLLSGAGALVWAIAVTAAGLVCGKALLLLMSNVRNFQLWFFGAIGIMGLLILGVYHIKHRKAHSFNQRNPQ